MPVWMPRTQKPAKKVAIASAVVDVVPAKPIEATTGTAITKTIAMAKNRLRSNQRASTSEPTVPPTWIMALRSEEHTSELQSLRHLVCRLLLEKKNKKRQ